MTAVTPTQVSRAAQERRLFSLWQVQSKTGKHKVARMTARQMGRRKGLKNTVDKIENNEGEKKQRNPQVPVLFHEKDDTQ